jgi:hypothetical protein
MLMVLTWANPRGAYANAGTVLEAEAALAVCAEELDGETLFDSVEDGDGDGDGEGDGDTFNDSTIWSDLFLFCSE